MGEAMDIMARGLLMLNLLLKPSLAMDMVMVVMEGMVMVVMEGMVMDMEAMDIMDMEAMDIMARGLLMLSPAMDMDMVAMEDMVMDMEAMDTTDKKEKYRLEFHKQCDAKNLVTSYMKLIYKESSHEFNFLYLIIK